MFKRKISVYKLMHLPLIYIDESGFSEDMPRIFGYASAGLRCFGTHDVMSKRRTNVIVALTEDKLLTASLFDCSINANVLRNNCTKLFTCCYASFHTSEWIQKAVEAAGCLLEYLPPYSPDLNPIKHKWAQAKALRRKLGCSIDELFQ